MNTTKETRDGERCSEDERCGLEFDQHLVALEGLSFVRIKRTPEGRRRCFWSPKPSARGERRGYSFANRTGRDAAIEFLRFLRANASTAYPHGMGTLQCIALDMLADRSRADTDVAGHAIGFFSELEAWLTWAVIHGGASLEPNAIAVAKKVPTP